MLLESHHGSIQSCEKVTSCQELAGAHYAVGWELHSVVGTWKDVSQLRSVEASAPLADHGEKT